MDGKHSVTFIQYIEQIHILFHHRPSIMTSAVLLTMYGQDWPYLLPFRYTQEKHTGHQRSRLPEWRISLHVRHLCFLHSASMELEQRLVCLKSSVHPISPLCTPLYTSHRHTFLRDHERATTSLPCRLPFLLGHNQAFANSFQASKVAFSTNQTRYLLLEISIQRYSSRSSTYSSSALFSIPTYAWKNLTTSSISLINGDSATLPCYHVQIITSTVLLGKVLAVVYVITCQHS